MFKQDDTNLKHVYNDHVNTDMSYEDFYELLAAKVWIHNDRNTKTVRSQMNDTKRI